MKRPIDRWIDEIEYLCSSNDYQVIIDNDLLLSAVTIIIIIIRAA